MMAQYNYGGIQDKYLTRNWWGYLHTEGTWHVKPFYSHQDITEAHESPFCKFVAGPFMASSTEGALLALHTAYANKERAVSNPDPKFVDLINKMLDE